MESTSNSFYSIFQRKMAPNATMDSPSEMFYTLLQRSTPHFSAIESPRDTVQAFLQRNTLPFPTIDSPLDNTYTLSTIICFLGAITIVSAGLLWRRHRQIADDNDENRNLQKIQDLRNLKTKHETASILSDLVDKDGAGAWPPKANHDSWPASLRPYKDIYLEMVPMLPAAEPSLDDDVNTERRIKYRSTMRKFLNDRINITEVKDIMAAVEAGNESALPRAQYNGFYACVAVCRHAYR